MRNGECGLVQVLHGERWVAATVPIASRNQTLVLGNFFAITGGAELWHSWAPHSEQ